MTTDILSLALSEYKIQAAKTSLLRSLGNLVYKVISTEDRCFSLRIYPPNHIDEAQVIAELTWLHFISSQNNRMVPHPVKNEKGDFLTYITLKSSKSSRLCCLFNWIEGEESSKNLSPELVETIGTAIARLHTYSHFNVPDGFKCRRYDAKWLHQQSLWIKDLPIDMGEYESQILSRAVERIYCEMVELGESSQYFGLIHSDLHFGNFIVSEGNVQAIDFDECGWGFYLFDLAAPLMELLDSPSQYPMLRECLLKGYEKVSPLPLAHKQQIEIFMAAQGLTFLQWVFRATNPEVRQKKREWVPKVIERIKQFISAER